MRADLARVHLLNKPPDYDRAVTELRRAIERDSRHEPSLQLLTFALAKKGATDEARATLARLEALNPSNETIPRLRQEIEPPASALAAPTGVGKSGR